MTRLTNGRLENLQDNLLQFQDAYSDPADKENYDIFVDALHVLNELKAFRNAANNPVAWLRKEDRNHASDTTHDFDVANEWGARGLHVIDLYASPVLPKQPELLSIGELLLRLEEQTGEKWVEESAQPVIPERPELRYGDNVLWFLNELAAFDASDIDSDDFDVYGEGRNGMEGCATISITELAADAAKLLSAQPVSEPYKLPSGWMLVPIEPTAAMFHAFNDCDYGRKSMRERYIQMIEAAPAQEQK